MSISLYKSSSYCSISAILASYNSAALPLRIFPSLLFPLFQGLSTRWCLEKQKRPSSGDSQWKHLAWLCLFSVSRSPRRQRRQIKTEISLPRVMFLVGSGLRGAKQKVWVISHLGSGSPDTSPPLTGKHLTLATFWAALTWKVSFSGWINTARKTL